MADFFVIIAEAVIARSYNSFSYDKKWQEGQLEHSFMKDFKFGRMTTEECYVNGYLPNHEEGCADHKRIFHDHIFMNHNTRTAW